MVGQGPLRLALLVICSAVCTTSIPQHITASAVRAAGEQGSQVGSVGAPVLQELRQDVISHGRRSVENLGAALMGRHAVQMQLRAAKKHHFQTWLHRFLRGIGKTMSQQGDRPENSHLAEAVLGTPLLHPSAIWSEEHSKLEGEEAAGEGDAKDAGEDSGEKPEPKEIDISSSIFVDADSFERDADAWMESHEDEIRYHMRWILLSGFFFIVATGVLIYSEVRVVLVTRECDTARVHGKPIEGLDDRKENIDEWRPYWSFGAVGGLAVTLMIILLSLCDLATSMLSSMGYVFRGCAQMALLYSILVAVVWSLFVVGCCWLCTRPWTAGLLILISFMGECALETAAAPAVVLWAIFSVGLFYIWWRWGKYLCVETPYEEEEKAPLLR